jgi:type IV secretory pathway protease TraF
MRIEIVVYERNMSESSSKRGPKRTFTDSESQNTGLYEYGKSSVGIIAWQDLILATCFPHYYIVMRAERPILLRFLNVLTSLNGFIIKRIVFLAKTPEKRIEC